MFAYLTQNSENILSGLNKMTNFNKAFIDNAKLENYSLCEEHPEGKHKAKVFKSALGIDKRDAEWLKKQILERVKNENPVESKRNEFGVFYRIDFELKRGFFKTKIRTAWKVLPNEDFPRLVSCYVI